MCSSNNLLIQCGMIFFFFSGIRLDLIFVLAVENDLIWRSWINLDFFSVGIGFDLVLFRDLKRHFLCVWIELKLVFVSRYQNWLGLRVEIEVAFISGVGRFFFFCVENSVALNIGVWDRPWLRFGIGIENEFSSVSRSKITLIFCVKASKWIWIQSVDRNGLDFSGGSKSNVFSVGGQISLAFRTDR